MPILAAVRRIVEGTQTMTIYKPIAALATKAAELAVDLGNDKAPDQNAVLNNGMKDVSFMVVRASCSQQSKPKNHCHC